MSDTTNISTTAIMVKFELPIGYSEEGGAIHRTVVMRKVKGIDIMKVQKDVELAKLASEKLDISTQNPVAIMRVNSHVLKLFSLLFTQVVLKVGTIENPDKRVFEGMYQEDLQVMMEEYSKLNGVDIEAARNMITGDNITPLH